MQETSWVPAEDVDWNRVRPLLDEALGELNELDRDAIALRYFENRPFAEIGVRLRINEEAARKRVDRALDKLGAALSRHGVTSSTAAIGVALGSHVSMAAPAGLAGSVTAASLAAGMSAGSAGVGTFLGLTVAGKIGFGVLGVAATVAIGAAWQEARAARESQAALVATSRQQEELRAQVRALRAELNAANGRAQAAEDDSAQLLGAIARAGSGSGAAGGGAQSAAQTAIEARYRRAQELAREGKWDTALTELLWCFDEGMAHESSFSGTRLSVLLGDIVKLAGNYPPAAAALRARRDRAEARLLVERADGSAAHDFTSINRALGESQRTLELYDRLPADDPRRRRLVLAGTYQLLVDVRRYPDAIQAVPFERMIPWFERESRPPNVANEPYPDMALKRHRRIVVGDAAKNVEVLAGAGDLVHAREFAARVLAFDSSSETRELLQRHVARAGQPRLLDAQE